MSLTVTENSEESVQCCRDSELDAATTGWVVKSVAVWLSCSPLSACYICSDDRSGSPDRRNSLSAQSSDIGKSPHVTGRRSLSRSLSPAAAAKVCWLSMSL